MVDRRFLAVLLVAAGAVGCGNGESEREDVETAAMAAEVMALVLQVDEIEGRPDDAAIRRLTDPAQRGWFESLSGEEMEYHLAKEELGLLFIEPGSLPGRLSEFALEGTWRTGETGEVTIRHGNLDLRFRVVRAGGRWYLGFGKVLRVIHR